MAMVTAFLAATVEVANLDREATIAAWRATKAALDGQPCEAPGWGALLGRKTALDGRLMVWGIYEPAATISMDVASMTEAELQAELHESETIDGEWPARVELLKREIGLRTNPRSPHHTEETLRKHHGIEMFTAPAGSCFVLP